jgi:2-amino-4-hydroxy-6-hydroxymethyldihydropteridine diphosphokinase
VIVVGIGANLPGSGHADALATCRAALACLPEQGVEIHSVSPWYESAPVPRSDQPWYVNAVIRVASRLSAAELLGALHKVEADFGRVRGGLNAARVLDLDLLDHDGQVSDRDAWPILPHPRMHARAFVLLPLRDLAPSWTHPRSGASLEQLISALPAGQEIRRHSV